MRVATSLLVSMLCVSPSWADEKTTNKPMPAAEPMADSIRKALERPREIVVKPQSLQAMLRTLTRQTNIHFEAEESAAARVSQINFAVRGANLRLSESLAQALEPHNLTYVVLSNRVIVANLDRAAILLFNQKVKIDFRGVPLVQVLSNLSEETGCDILLDPHVGNASQNGVTLKTSRLSLEAAVRVIAAQANLDVVRLENMLFVTSAQKASTLRESLVEMNQRRPAVARNVPGPGAGLGGFGLQGGAGMIGGPGLGALGGGGFGGAPFQPPQPKPSAKPTTAPEEQKKPAPPTKPEGKEVISLTGAEEQADAPAKPAPVQANEPVFSPVQVQALLRQTVPEFKEIDDPATTLEQLLYALSVRLTGLPSSLQFTYNERAFREAGILDPRDARPAEKKIPRQVGVRFSTYVQMILDRAFQETPVTYVIRNDRIEVTTRAALIQEFYPELSPEYTGTLSPLIHLRLDRVPLQEALAKLNEIADTNIVLAPEVDKAKHPISVNLNNVPLGTAVETVTALAGLAVERKGRVLYVTTSERVSPPPATKLPPAR